MQRFLALGQIPELRSDPIDPERGIPVVEIYIPVNTYWELQDIIKKMRYARAVGISVDHLWVEFANLVKERIVSERDRVWFSKNYVGK